jgi:hypothetical protein
VLKVLRGLAGCYGVKLRVARFSGVEDLKI